MSGETVIGGEGDNGADSKGLEAEATFVVQDDVPIALNLNVFVKVAGSRLALEAISAPPGLPEADKVDIRH
jgi:hypothetical protein